MNTAVAELNKVLARRGIVAAPLRSDGRASFSYDVNRRLDAYPRPGGRFILEAVVAVLPAAPSLRAALVDRALLYATACMRTRHDVLCFIPAAGSLALQRNIAFRGLPADLEASISGFLVTVDAWCAVLQAPGAKVAV